MKTKMLTLGYLLISTVVFAIMPDMPITKCTVTSGRGAFSDSLAITGLLESAADYIAGAAAITVDINCGSMQSPLSVPFEVNDTTFKKGKFKGVAKDGVSTYTFACDTKSTKFTFTAKKADLTGLCCPFTLIIEISPSAAAVVLNEDIVNGKKDCPSILMMGVLNDLEITKFTYKFGKTISTDSFSVQGTFSVDGIFDLDKPFILTLGSQNYYIPGSAFKSNKGVASCTNAPAAQGGLVKAKFDTNTGAFTITVKNTILEDYGNVPFDLSLFGIQLGVIETVNLRDPYDRVPGSFMGITMFNGGIGLEYYTFVKGDFYRGDGAGIAEVYYDSNGSVSEYIDFESGDYGQQEYQWSEEADGVHLTEYYWPAASGYENYRFNFDTLVVPTDLQFNKKYQNISSGNGRHRVYGVTYDLNGTAATTCEIVGVENVTVHGVKYDAYKITVSLVINSGSKGQYTGRLDQNTTYWAVPGTGVVKSKINYYYKMTLSGLGSETWQGSEIREMIN